ncbi:alanine--tRNA ligase [Candidatus Profftia tarda]|nr:alanine--tRNA ligase [Candidatus Profftia tarda]
MRNSSADIRQSFLDFYHSKGHQILDSSSLVPDNDSTLLFTNAGMNQFKDVFLGIDQPKYFRATTCQRCIRAGGKHNDLENVGYTARHHTFFEMLGNFSFGDYFKRDAIKFAWELLTSKNWFGIPKEKLWITVYETDEESFNIWAHEINIPCNRIIRIGDDKGFPFVSDNFWQMGDTGPCGPCTEIFYDHGDHLSGGLPGSTEANGDRYIEIWNIVFIQFNRQSDGLMIPLSTPSVDTGMGLERIAAVLQCVHSNYDIDIFRALINATAVVIGSSNVSGIYIKSLRVISDHIRSCAFLIADGVLPSNEGRGYTLRRIIRRALRHGNIIGTKDTFFYKLVRPLIDIMGLTANHLRNKKSMIERIIKTEEEQFERTLERGLLLLDKELSRLTGDTLDGGVAFCLYDTYGFPLDLTIEVCYERNIKVDQIEFERLIEEQRYRARTYSSFNVDYSRIICVNHQSIFSGYEYIKQSSTVTALFRNGQSTEVINSGEEGIVFLNETPFYAESGGQIGDQGELIAYNMRFLVTDTQKYGPAIGHHGNISEGLLRVGDIVDANINKFRRLCISLNHSATHLLHAALLQVLGDHVSQKGSLVSDSSLRFDFFHFEPIKCNDIYQVEDIVNSQIRLNLPITAQMMDLETAKTKHSKFFLNKQYDKIVRVLSIGDVSSELCCGTHANQTGDIGLFRIMSETGISSGVRRIAAVTGEYAIDIMHQDVKIIRESASLLKSDRYRILDKIIALIKNNSQLEKELQQFKEQKAIQDSAVLCRYIVDVGGVKMLVKHLDNVEAKILRSMVDELKNKLGSVVVVLSASFKGKISLVVGVSKDLTDKVHACSIISMLINKIGGKGGGRDDIAMASGSNAASLPQALNDLSSWIATKLSFKIIE